MAFLVTPIRDPARVRGDQTTSTASLRRPLVCLWVAEGGPGGRLVAHWVREEDLDADDSCEPITAFLQSSDTAIA
jgi:hypothetical protein